jgi:hypothetical protein
MPQDGPTAGRCAVEGRNPSMRFDRELITVQSVVRVQRRVGDQRAGERS